MNKFAVFDIDGTLLRWQLYHSLVDKLAANGELGGGSYAQFNEARLRWKRREDRYGFAQYEKIVVETFEKMLPQLKTESLDKLVDGVIEEYKDQTYVYTRELLKKLKAQDYFLIAISGSHHELVKHIAQYYGFDEYVGSQYVRSKAYFTGEGMIASKHKKEILQKIVKDHRLTYKNSYGIGDSKGDASMLEIVEHSIAFNPDHKLFEIAQQHQWKIVVERKNMIYHLENQNGQYVLAETN